MEDDPNFVLGIEFNEIFGTPDQLVMKWGLRWKFNHAYFIDYGDGPMQYIVNRAGRPTEHIDRVLSFHEAKKSMLAHWRMKGEGD